MVPQKSGVGTCRRHRIRSTVVRKRSATLTGYVALLRAVNVGGTGKLPMTTLARMCQAVGFEHVKTYIASGNVVFRSGGSEDQVRSALQDQLHAYAGKSGGVIVRTAAEVAGTLARNPFADSPGNRVMALFMDGALPADPLAPPLSFHHGKR